MDVTNNNYFSREANMNFMSNSQFKDFMKCESCALAKLKGKYQIPVTTALLVGSYVDAYFEGTLDDFKNNHPEILKRDGTLKADYVQADYIIERIKRDELFMKYMSGEKQIIMTGEIEKVPFKIKIDSYHKGKAIVDLKVVKDFQLLWNNLIQGKQSFVEFWGYDIQGAIYQEIVYQNTGVKLPFFIAAVTKETEPDICVMNVPQERLDLCMDIVRAMAPRFQAVKQGTENPSRCEKCNYCKKTKVLDKIIDYRDLEVKS